MEKLDKHIREKLEKRTIKPSNEAWSKISEELGPYKKSNHRNSWLAIAAGLVVICALSVLWYTNTAFPKIENTNIVNQDKNSDRVEGIDIEIESKQAEFENTKMWEKIEVVQGDVDEINGNDLPKIAANGNRINDKAQLAEKSDNDEAVLAELEQETNIIEQKANEVLAQVMIMEENAQQVSDVEIDSLLRAAQKDILSERINSGNSKIDALALLNEVEWELSEDSRNQLFDKLKENFFKLRTAVAARNN